MVKIIFWALVFGAFLPLLIAVLVIGGLIVVFLVIPIVKANRRLNQVKRAERSAALATAKADRWSK